MKQAMQFVVILVLKLLGSSASQEFLFDEVDSFEHSSPSIQANAVLGLIKRVIPGHAHKFHVAISVSDYYGNGRKDTFTLKTFMTNGKFGYERHLSITGSTGVAAAAGFNMFLKYYCDCHVSWSGRQLNVPEVLPAIKKRVEYEYLERFRYYQNVCTSSYSYVWWNWTRWEEEIDWMALQGINLPLAFNGQEEVWRRVYTYLGLNETDISSYFTGPAFLAWGRMGNIARWGGPLPHSWYGKQMHLQQQILRRMREFGMTPILPAFSGHFPKALLRIFPNIKYHRCSGWGHFSQKYETYFLDPTDAVFQMIQRLFLQTQMVLYNGTNHVYSIDLFNELSPPSSTVKYLTSASLNAYRSLVNVDQSAVWIMQGWLFKKRSFWSPKRIQALIEGPPLGKLIILDLAAELYPIWRWTDGFYGRPFIWCMLHNFGGTQRMYGKLTHVVNEILSLRDQHLRNFVGTGMAPEGIEQNDVVYELMSEMMWRDADFDINTWNRNYTTRRYGSFSVNAWKAWQILLKTVYNCTDNHENHNKVIPVRRPSFFLLKKLQMWYDSTQLQKGWRILLQDRVKLRDSPTYRYDLIITGCQVLIDLTATVYINLTRAYQAKSIALVEKFASVMDYLLKDINSLLMTDGRFLLGSWIAAAKLQASNEYESRLYEFNAKNQITNWGPEANHNDYGNKLWAGLYRSYYAVRWKIFSEMILKCLRTGAKFDQDIFDGKVLQFEQSWGRAEKQYSFTPCGNTLNTSVTLFEKYKRYFYVETT